MYDDLVLRLRDAAKISEALAILLPHSDGNATAKLYNEAADAIEELQKRVPKTPHGDLIDRDALMKGEGRYIISFGKEGIDVAEINRAPTIIPASEEGET